MEKRIKTHYESPQSEIIQLHLSSSVAQINVSSPDGMVGKNNFQKTFEESEDW